MDIARLDHLVLTVADVERTVDFYVEVLGMTAQTFRGNRIALTFGAQKINVHKFGHEFEPKAAQPTPGSADLCFIVNDDIETVQRSLRRSGVPLVEGPVIRTGAQGPITSIYLRDPDGNLIELSTYVTTPAGA